MTGVLALWAVPRSRSTAFERMMLQRGDLDVVHEPFSYLVASGQFTVDGVTVDSLTALLDRLLAKAVRRPVFIKETTDYEYGPLLHDARLYRRVRNTFLIRRPEDVVASYYALKPEMTLEEVGFHRLHELFEAVRAATGEVPVLLDADELVREPAALVRTYCRRVGLAFRPESLQWSAGDRPEWGLTERWHREVSASTGFADIGRSHPVDPARAEWLAEVARFHQPFYTELYSHRLVPDPADSG